MSKTVKTYIAIIMGVLLCCAVQAYENLVIVGPGDATPVRGEGTDPAFDSIEGINRLIYTLKKRGFTGILDRVDLHDFDTEKFITFNPIGDSVPEHRFLHKCMDDVKKEFSQGLETRLAAERNGLDFWIWLPIVYSVGCPPVVDELGLDKTNWGYEHTYSLEHRDQLVVDRKGKTQYGVLEYAYPGVRENMVETILSFIEKTGAKKVIACMRSETSQMMPPPEHADQYGFNEPVVQDMLKLYNVNILEDPRFDYKSPDFDVNDPMLENWRILRGSYLTQFYRQLREAVNKIDPEIQIGVQLPGGDYIGPPLGNMKIEWKKWVDEGLIDLVILNITLEATLDREAYKKGYLTDANTGKGIHPVSLWRDYIDKSKNPNIKLIQASGNHLFFREPDKGYDGWRTDFWHLSYNYAWPQRWMQWQKDIKDFGYIKYIVEDFDQMPANNECYFGGWGDPRHSDKLRKSSGFWDWIGNGDDEKPFAQKEIKQGSEGLAIKLTSANSSKRYLQAKRWGATSRRDYVFCVDSGMYNGKFTLEYAVFRPDAKSSLTVSMMDRRMFKMDEIGVSFDHTGKISYIDNGIKVPTDCSVEISKWQRFKFDVDLENLRYSIFIDNKPICKGAVVKPSDTYAPNYNKILFDPGNLPGTAVYIDNVDCLWVPEFYRPRGIETEVINDDFEDYESEAAYANKSFGQWRVEGGEGVFIENDTSYGLGVNSLRAIGGGAITRDVVLDLDKSDYVVIDINVLARSDIEDYVYIIPPKEGLKSENGTVISLTNSSGDIIVSVNAQANGSWLVYDGGNYVSIGKPVEYDIWQTISMVIDRKANEYSFVLQPIGELPRRLSTQRCGAAISGSCKLKILPSENKKHNTCYDNIKITSFEK